MNIKIKKYSLIPFLILVLIIFHSALISSSDKKTFELKTLEGKWEGVGEFLLPAVNTNMEITGRAEFAYDKNNNYLRTALTGEKFLFSYSDSGHLALDKNSDSLTWEVWDNFGKHAKYRGVVDGNTILGSRKHGKNQYDVKIVMVHNDSIDFKLTTNYPNGTSKDKATFHLWRVK